MTKKYSLKEKLWLYPGKAGWYFITIQSDITKDIDFNFGHEKRGWGSLPVTVKIGQTTWKTSIFSDKKSHTYLLPIKADVRKKEQLLEGDVLALTIELSRQ